MGEMADLTLDYGDDLLDPDYCCDPEDDWSGTYQSRFDYETEWLMKDGTLIQLTQMDDRHLNNTIRMLATKNQDGHPSLEPMWAELKRRASCS